jgi:hypothetical protein
MPPLSARCPSNSKALLPTRHLNQQLEKLDDILLVSDGGTLNDFGSYGWPDCSQDGMRLAQGSPATSSLLYYLRTRMECL